MMKSLDWKAAVLSGPGPASSREAVLLALKGLAMGCADLVPGVSGGTIALISGIYDQLLKAISSLGDGLKLLCRLQIKKALAAIHFRFLLCLFAGISTAIIGLARLMHFLLTVYPVPTWGAFFGLIAASVILIGKPARIWRGSGALLFLTGTAASYLLVGMIPVTTPESAWFIFFSGMIAICAMILPGISGAFLLLILGKYQFITGALKNPFLTENLMIIIVFCGGCLTGLLGFSRLLSYMMDHHHQGTLALLTGLMLGSLRKIWPWKEVLDSIVIRGKVHILSTKNILPGELDGEFFLTLSLAATGFIIIFVLQKMTEK